MVDHAHEWMQAWRSAGEALARVRREELRPLDGTKALPLLTGPADYQQELPAKAKAIVRACLAAALVHEARRDA